MVERVYEGKGGLSLHHFDFYRLHEAGIVARELEEVLEDPKVVIAVEWGDVVHNVLPIDHIEIKLERQADNEDARKISVTYSEKFSYILKGLK